MARRVSLKGGGLDALFGGNQAPQSLSVTPAAQASEAPPIVSTPPALARPQASSKRASKQASTISSKPDSSRAISDSILTAVKRVVRTPGREVSYVRLSSDEKGQLAEIVYTRKREGKKSTENEIIRIAINYLLEDHKARGEGSVLAHLLTELEV